MKKVIFIMLACLVSLTMQAQNEHLKFMGIPIDGTIKAFQKELKKKGFSHDSSEDGNRTYEGYFAGEKVLLHVFFDKSSKIVYQVGVVIPCYFEDIAQQKYLSLKLELTSKYKAADLSTYQMVYNNSGELLGKVIESGNLNSLNWSREYQNKEGVNVTEISVSKPVLKKFEGVDTLGFASIIMDNWANVGSIFIKTTKITNNRYSIKLQKYENCVVIAYTDSQNIRKIMMTKRDDL